MKKIDLTNNKTDIFYKMIYPLFPNEFLFGNNYENFAALVSSKFILNAQQWEHILEHWEEKEELLATPEVPTGISRESEKKLIEVGQKLKSNHKNTVLLCTEVGLIPEDTFTPPNTFRYKFRIVGTNRNTALRHSLLNDLLDKGLWSIVNS